MRIKVNQKIRPPFCHFLGFACYSILDLRLERTLYGKGMWFFAVLTLRIFFSELPLQAYRLEPLILKHYSNISPVQIHWYNTANPLPYEHMKPSFLNPTKEPTSVTDSESVSTVPSPTTSPVMVRRHYGESITNIGKASILGNCSLCPLFYI